MSERALTPFEKYKDACRVADRRIPVAEYIASLPAEERAVLEENERKARCPNCGHIPLDLSPIDS